MKINASAGRRTKVDLRRHCESLSLKTTDPEEATHLAAIYRVMVFGGTLTVQIAGEEGKTVVEYENSVGSRS